jgi:hypothetical protein
MNRLSLPQGHDARTTTQGTGSARARQPWRGQSRHHRLRLGWESREVERRRHQHNNQPSNKRLPRRRQKRRRRQWPPSWDLAATTLVLAAEAVAALIADDADGGNNGVAVVDPSRRVSRGWGGSKHKRCAARPATGSTVVVFFKFQTCPYFNLL